MSEVALAGARGKLPLCKLGVFDEQDWDANPQQHYHARRAWRMSTFSRVVQSHYQMVLITLTLPV